MLLSNSRMRAYHQSAFFVISGKKSGLDLRTDTVHYVDLHESLQMAWGTQIAKQDKEITITELAPEMRRGFREMQDQFTGLQGEFTGLKGPVHRT